MKLSHALYTSFSLAIVATPMACSSEPAGEGASESDVAASRDPIGTFEAYTTMAVPTDDRMYDVKTRVWITLESEGTYHIGMSSTCTPSPCPDVLAEASATVSEDGKYVLEKRGEERHILFPGSQTLTDDYTYELDGKELKTTGAIDQKEDSLFLSGDPWCKSISDCTNQNLTGAGWSCVKNVCTNAK